MCKGSLETGQNEFAGAEADFASGISGVPQGLEPFDSFLNNDLVATDEDWAVGTANALAGDPVGSDFTFGFPATPSDVADDLTLSQSVISGGQTELADASMDFAAGDYATAAHEAVIGSFDVYDFPVEQVFIGAVDQLLGL